MFSCFLMQMDCTNKKQGSSKRKKKTKQFYFYIVEKQEDISRAVTGEGGVGTILIVADFKRGRDVIRKGEKSYFLSE